MHCSEFHHRLNVVLDERRNPAADQRLADHASGCENCRQILNDQRALLSGLSRVRTPLLPSNFAQRVVLAAEVQTSQAALRFRRLHRPIWRVAGALLAAAATMLLAVGTLWYARHREPVVAENGDAASPPVRARGGFRGFAVATPPRAGRKSSKHASSPVTSADLLLEAPRLPSRLRGSLGEIAMGLPDAARRLDELEQLAPGLRPLRASLSLIWDTLCRTIPTGRSQSPEPARPRTSLSVAEFLLLA